MKKFFALLVFVAMSQASFAQEAGRFRMVLEAGPAIPKGGGIGMLFNAEPKINVADNMAVGVRFGMAGLAKDVTYYDLTDDYEGDLSMNLSASATFDYFFHREGSKLAPFIGAGYGYYALSNVKVKSDDFTNPDNFGDLSANFKWAPMIRVGLELNKFRMGAEYNFIPSSDLQNASGQVIGEAINQYFAFTFGAFLGGGRWH
ncbi:outer membrane beta-barrel protein [Algoriphagus chordae]|uniref:Outer membrane protein W n=1 Tax=Algoriphagus chordae TaxID=237019 RepID=A0A2W7R3N4_9BACT|nr:outer membrane beta-barrel protein [Algoriphagus chordae]PZX48689.1 outer membrane protein W [Algoriphagus chordae]